MNRVLLLIIMELRTYSSGRITMGPSIEWKDVNYSIKDKLSDDLNIVSLFLSNLFISCKNFS